MFSNEYGVYYIMKLRHEEMIRKAENAWKWEELKQESFIQKAARKWMEVQKPKVTQTNCGCACG